jgi:pyruvate kinase
LVRLERHLTSLESAMKASIARVPPDRREGARNLVHYVALRQHDLRDLQAELAELGLSSLGRSESCVRASVLQVARRAHEALAIHGAASARIELRRLEAQGTDPRAWETAKHDLHRQTRAVLGPKPDDRHIYVMVTAPTAAEAGREWMVKLLRAGMNVLRINCAHEGPDEWRKTVDSLREARAETGKECRILMDLAGPKIRTGPIAGGTNIATWKVSKDEVGSVVAPARVVVQRASAAREDAGGAALVLADDDFALLRAGDVLRFRDVRGKRRSLHMREVGPDAAVATCVRRAYLRDRASAHLLRAGKELTVVRLVVGRGEGAAIDLKADERFVLTSRVVKGRPPRRNRAGHVTRQALVACTLPAALELLAVGHRVLFDDGRIEAIVQEAAPSRGDYVLRVVRTRKATAKLRAEKGINLPDTPTRIPALSDEDRRALAFVVEHADAVSLSFVRRAEDVRALHEALERLGARTIAVVLKIETRVGFENLPRLLLEGLRRPPLGVMVARGDLAVEVGYERLAELQEEILWLCEASHVPAIWATQVLETLARTGVPSRAEVTDAAAGVAAECVMLNKGPYVEEAVRVLSDILRRMEKHRFKKRSLYRKLQVSALTAP